MKRISISLVLFFVAKIFLWQMKDVFEEKAIFLDYSPLLEVTIEAAFSKLNGDPQLRMSDHVGVWPPEILVVSLFYPGSPLIRRFSFYHYAMYESAITSHLVKQTR